MDTVTAGVIDGDIPSMIVYGAPGVGKSHTIMKALDAKQEQDDEFYVDVIKGSVRAPGLLQALFKARLGGVVVLDDSDSIFNDEDALNMLKAALDTSEVRNISWRKESAWLLPLAEDQGVSISDIKDFVFEGSVIFITNINLKKRAESKDKMADHFQALISRSLFIDLTMDSSRAKSLRVYDVFVNKGMGSSLGLSNEEAIEVADYIVDNRGRLDEVSLRMAKMITNLFISQPSEWKEIVEITKMV